MSDGIAQVGSVLQAHQALAADLVQQQSAMIDAQAKRIERYDVQTDDMMTQMKNRLQFMGKIYENLDAETKENRELRAENKALLDKLLKLKGVDL